MSIELMPNLHTSFAMDELWFKLLSIELLRGDQLEQQLIGTHVLIIVKNGNGQLTTDLADYRLKQDTVHIAFPSQTIGVPAETAEALEFYLIKFHIYHDAALVEESFFQAEIPIYPEAQSLILCDLIYSCSQSEHTLERFRGQFVFQELLYWIMKNVRLLPDSDSRTALDRSKAYIESHYNESLTIEQLARIADISPKYYVDLFKKTYGTSAIDYLTQVRVNFAKQFMMQSEVRLRDIALQVGYNDEFYFSRKFKKEVGVSPTVYMKNRRRKIVAYSSSIIGQLLALKIIPYAAPLHPKWTAYYHKTYRMNIPLHLSAYRFNQDWETNIEALVHAQPDMIISSSEDLHPKEKERLEQVAPVFFIPWNEKNWREHLQLTAQALGMHEESDSWLRSYDRKVKLVRERLKREIADGTVLIMSLHKISYHFCPSRGMRDVLYHDLQLNAPSGLDADEYNQRITADQLVEFDADRIFLNVCQEPDSLHHWQSLQQSTLWQDLKAVRRNQVYLISSDPWREYSAYASERMVDDVLKLLSGDRAN